MGLWRVLQFKKVGEETFTNIPETMILAVEAHVWYDARIIVQRYYQAPYDCTVISPMEDNEIPTHRLVEHPLRGVVVMVNEGDKEWMNQIAEEAAHGSPEVEEACATPSEGGNLPDERRLGGESEGLRSSATEGPKEEPTHRTP